MNRISLPLMKDKEVPSTDRRTDVGTGVESQ